VYDFEFVQELKSISGKGELGEIDTLADFMSAKIMALIYIASHRLPEQDFYKAYMFYLGASYKLATSAFPFSHTTTHKVNRVISLLMARRLIKLALIHNKCTWKHAKAIHFRMSSTSNTVYVVSLEPVGLDYILLRAKISNELFEELSKAATFGNIRHIERILTSFNKARP